MGLREDIRTALAGVAVTLPQASFDMRHGEESGFVVQVSARETVDAVSEDSPNEAVRFIAPASSFPTLDKGSLVEVGGVYRLVTSLRTDPVGASLSFGASDAMDAITARYTGTRRDGDTVRRLNDPVNILAIESAALPPMYGEAAAPGYEQSWNLCIAEDAWLDTSAPQISDALEFEHPKHDHETLRLRVSSVVKHDGWWMLKARPRGGV